MQATSGTPAANPLQAVVFDMDGLMFNTEALYELATRTILQRRGKTCTGNLLDAMMGRQPPIAIQIMIDWHALDDTVDGIASETEEIFAEILDDRLVTMPGLTELLDATESAGIPKAIATSSGRKFVRGVLTRFQLEPRFAFVLTAEDVAQGKPHPEIYLTAAAKLGLAPQQILVLEDSAAGCLAAAAAGAFAVAVPDGQSQTHRFDGAQFIADSLADPRIYQVLGLAAPSPARPA